MAHELSSCGTWAQLLHGMWDLPRPGLDPVSPASAGGFLTTVPPGKPCHYFLSLTASPFSLHSLTSLLSNCMSLLFGTQGRTRKLKPFSTNKKLGAQRDFCTQADPAGPCSASIPPFL